MKTSEINLSESMYFQSDSARALENNPMLLELDANQRVVKCSDSICIKRCITKD